ncbi:hypothetical protein CEUSTIGMA_g2302.t1 [Chlamydomonas eustigma]|uniref:RING-type domain-containing protein n=1 Tax=Chlamydomonas eustigma TaxID=1157962 RepID=A0A250WVR6_9CHLO|nr:hypothetical protein CEUSTIGMA_g2302.t1 [Chlamydomonas eustigma]|eukprot:GAX74856.1 hypothetical protein CEUSTIGMA_g2302.t1 [Chlamydomonas eustigma]
MYSGSDSVDMTEYFRTMKAKYAPRMTVITHVIGVIIIVLIRGSSGQQSCAPLRPSATQLPFFQDFMNSSVSVQELLPSLGACTSWPIVIPYSSSSACSQENGTMLVEFWLTNGSSAIDSQRTYAGLYLLAAASSSPPSVSISSTGNVVFSPSLPPASVSTQASLQYTFMDASNTADEKTLFRFTLPVGAYFNQNNNPSQTWYLTLANMATSSSWDQLQYSIRLTCMAASQLPCPRPSPDVWECNSPWPGTTGVANGQCLTLSSSQKSCQCNASFTDIACNIPVTQLTSSGTSVSVSIPGNSWRYFYVNVPYQGNANLLIEMLKTPLSYNTYQPVLQLASRSSGINPVASYNVPGYSSLDPSDFILSGSCLCNTCDCYIPYQAPDLIYQEVQLSGSSDSFSWWIGIFNNAPYVGPVSSVNALTLYATWSTASVGSTPSPLCPRSCSGQGSCLYPPRYSVQAANQPLYQCSCYAGYGGEYCQGALQNVKLSSSNSFQTGTISLPPGAWTYYYVTIDTNSLVSGYNTMTLSWYDGATLPSNLYFIFSPVYSNSLGNLYFMPAASWVLNTSTTVPIPSIGSQTSSYLSVWIMGVLNSNAEVATTSSYTLSLSFPAYNNLNLLSTLQMGLIGSVSAMIVVLIIFMAIKLLVMRRHNRVRMLSDEELGGGLQRPGRRHAAVLGVPQDIIDTFPQFKFEIATYEQRQKEAAVNAPETANAEHPKAQEPEDCDKLEDAAPPPTSSQDKEHQDHQKGHEDDDDSSAAPQCSICICDYEEGEVLRRLPCLHVFHQTCIDQWMTQHRTCPNCRWALCPQEADANVGRRRGSRNRVQALATTEEPQNAVPTASPTGDNPQEPALRQHAQGSETASVAGTPRLLTFNVIAPTSNASRSRRVRRTVVVAVAEGQAVSLTTRQAPPEAQESIQSVPPVIQE